MKKSGRTLKQRLYGLKHLSSRLKRVRHFRGHGVHSPYVYDIVRKVFMQSKLVCEQRDLYDALVGRGIAQRRCVQLQNLVAHCGYDSWRIDSMEECNFLVCTLDSTNDSLEGYAAYAREHGFTLCILDPYSNANRWAACSRIVEQHRSTTVDNRAYLLVFNNHLPKQVFVL
jgi:hypothetical protein